MTNAIYPTTTEPYSGKSVIALGLMNLLSGKTEKIAYFKPIISNKNADAEKDIHLETISKQFGLTAAQKGFMVAVPILGGSLVRLPMGLLVDHIGPKKTGILGQLIVFIPLLFTHVTF